LPNQTLQKGTQTKLAGIRDELTHLNNQIATEDIPYQQVNVQSDIFFALHAQLTE
jgi:hypothetical protein